MGSGGVQSARRRMTRLCETRGEEEEEEEEEGEMMSPV
jgi:hypothetical protein